MHIWKKIGSLQRMAETHIEEQIAPWRVTSLSLSITTRIIHYGSFDFDHERVQGETTALFFFEASQPDGLGVIRGSALLRDDGTFDILQQSVEEWRSSE